MRLIDADALQNILLTIATALEHEYGSLGGAVSGCMKHIDNAPTVDAVPVVRCRECIHRYTENCPMFFHASYWHEGYEEYVDDDTDHTEDDYFCPEGKRKEGAD